jgi:hypothetical protein
MNLAKAIPIVEPVHLFSKGLANSGEYDFTPSPVECRNWLAAWCFSVQRRRAISGGKCGGHENALPCVIRKTRLLARAALKAPTEASAAD